MYGNLIGWVIASILGTVMSVLLYTFNVLAGVTSPSDFIKDPANLALIKVPAQTFLNMDSSVDGGALYREAIAEVLKNKNAYKPGTKIEGSMLGGLKALDKILAASRCAKADIFRSNPEEVITFQPTPPSLEAMEYLYSRMAAVAQHYANNKQYSESRKYAEALFTMGARMTEERLTYRQFHLGMGMMASATMILRALPDNPTQAAAVREWYDKYTQFGKPLIARHQVIRHIDYGIVRKHAGDQYYFARTKDMDRMWRVEAALQIGFLKDRAPKKADRVAAPIVLKKMMQESDPVIQCAAKTALNAQAKEINQMGGL